jgi:hypothetical protein
MDRKRAAKPVLGRFAKVAVTGNFDGAPAVCPPFVRRTALLYPVEAERERLGEF